MFPILKVLIDWDWVVDLFWLITSDPNEFLI